MANLFSKTSSKEVLASVKIEGQQGDKHEAFSPDLKLKDVLNWYDQVQSEYSDDYEVGPLTIKYIIHKK